MLTTRLLTRTAALAALTFVAAPGGASAAVGDTSGARVFTKIELG